MAQLITELLWLQSLFKELRIELPKSIVIWCDNHSANALAMNPVFHACTKHVDIDTHFIREKVASGLIEPRYVLIEFQVADLLTKRLSRDRLQFLYSKLNLVPSTQFSLRGNVREANLCNNSISFKGGGSADSSLKTKVSSTGA
ncbi:hypothetical protein ACOSQ2_030513 [Xanthoceras sorbifolium]